MTPISLKEVLLNKSNSKNRDQTFELDLLKKNFERSIERKINLSHAFIMLFCYALIFITQIEYSLSGDLYNTFSLILYLIIYGLIWLREIKKIKRLPLASKARKAYESVWICIFISIGGALFLIPHYYFKGTSVYININYLIFFPLIAMPILVFAINWMTNKIAKYFDPEWYE